MGCCSAFAKIILSAINFVVFIFSLGLVALGSILAFVPKVVLKDVYNEALDASKTAGWSVPDTAEEMRDLPMVYEIGISIFVLGVVLFALTMMGCCGICCTTCCKVLLLVFAIVVIALMIIEIVVGSLFLVTDSTLHENIRSQLKDKISDDYNEQGTDSFSTAINVVNHYFECCGIDGDADFGTKPHASCGVNTEGCYTKLLDKLEDNKKWAGLGLAALLVFQLMEVIFAIVIYKAAPKILPV